MEIRETEADFDPSLPSWLRDFTRYIRVWCVVDYVSTS